MTSAENKFAGKWLEIKGELQKVWGKLSDSDLDRTMGDFKAIGGLLQQRYGAVQETYADKLKEIFQRFETPKVNFEPLKNAIRPN